MTDRYPQLLRNPGRRWWVPPLGLLVAALTLVVASVGVVLAASTVGAMLGVEEPFSEEALSADTPLGLAANNLAIAMIVPAVLVAVLAVHRERIGWLSSVVARLRPGLLGRFFVVAFGLVVVFFGATFLVPPVGFGDVDVPSGGRLLALFAVILLTTPLQAAAEEYGFRGYLTQALCSWFARPRVGTVVAAVVTAFLFALAHGVQDAWLFSDRFLFGLVASWLAWRTGGLEAAIALHVANNLVSLGYSATTGTLAESLAASSLDWEYAVIDVAMMLVFAVTVHRLAGRWQLTVRRVVAQPGPPDSSPSGSGVLSGPPAVGYPDARSDSHWGMG